MIKYKFLWLFSALLLAGCDVEPHMQSAPIYPEPGNDSKSEVKNAKRQAKFATVQKGFQLYRANCATCHGDQGQGAPNWTQTGADGKYPPPPLNGTGHAWHHPRSVLVKTIKEGTLGIGGKMPAWQGKLTDAEIGLIITWFQSRWPDELYQAWARMDREVSR